jgi:hypothetical protein
VQILHKPRGANVLSPNHYMYYMGDPYWLKFFATDEGIESLPPCF